MSEVPKGFRSGTRRSRLALAGAAGVACLALLAGTAAPAVARSGGPATEGAQTDSVAISATAADAMLQYSVRPAAGFEGGAAVLGADLAAAGYDVIGRDGDALVVLGAAGVRVGLSSFAGAELVSATPYSVPATIPGPSDASQDAVLPARLQGKEYPTFYRGYRTVKAYQQYETDLAAAYPELVRVKDFGTSWTGKNPMRVVCVTANAATGCALDPTAPKPRFLIVGQTHARELTTSELMWRYLAYLTDGYGTNADVTALLDSTEIWIAPQVNPDGTQTVEQGIEESGLGSSSPAWQRKNMNDTYSSPACGGQWAYSQEGVDINRNFDVDWGHTGTSKTPCNLTYGGPSAASEVETIAQQELFAKLFRDRRDPGMDAPAPADTTGGMLTLHSYANQVLLPWGFTTKHAPNDAGLRSYAFRMSYFNNFETGQSGEVLYNSSGATEDWLYDQLGVPGFTWEIGPNGGGCSGFFPVYTCQDGFWTQNRDALMYAAAAATQPYTMALGPTAVSVQAKPKGTKKSKIKVTAALDDGAYGNIGVGRPTAQNVTAARIFADAAPWAGGTAKPMKIKGSGAAVKAKAIVKSKSPVGKLVYVQGKDADGNWGPVRAVWLKKP